MSQLRSSHRLPHVDRPSKNEKFILSRKRIQADWTVAEIQLRSGRGGGDLSRRPGRVRREHQGVEPCPGAVKRYCPGRRAPEPRGRERPLCGSPSRGAPPALRCRFNGPFRFPAGAREGYPASVKGPGLRGLSSPFPHRGGLGLFPAPWVEAEGGRGRVRGGGGRACFGRLPPPAGPPSGSPAPAWPGSLGARRGRRVRHRGAAQTSRTGPALPALGSQGRRGSGAGTAALVGLFRAARGASGRTAQAPPPVDAPPGARAPRTSAAAPAPT